MGVRTLRPLMQRLMAEGLSPDTPAAIVERASTPGERHVLSTVAGLPDAVDAADVQAPALLIIGAVLKPEIR